MLRLLLAKRCFLCERAIKRNFVACVDCHPLLEDVSISSHKEKMCEVCGKLDGKCICDRITNLDATVFPYFYNDITKNIAVSIKKVYNKDKITHLAEEMATAMKSKALLSGYDYVTYIPTTIDKIEERGFNISFLLAKEFSKLVNKELVKPVIVREKVGVDQHTLKVTQRKENALRQYQPTGEIISGSFILIDDIVTGGDTLNRCAELLLKAGAKNVIGLTAFGTGRTEEI